jgi:hypothetical protein
MWGWLASSRCAYRTISFFLVKKPDCDSLQVSGASAGSIAALALLSGVPLGEITSNVLRIASEVGAALMGTFFLVSPFFRSQYPGRIFQFLIIFSVVDPDPVDL